MTPAQIVPDVASPPVSRPAPPADSPTGGFGKIVHDLGAVMAGADSAEDSFANGTGDLQSAIYERARADVALAVATAAAQRSSQALQSIFNMQV